MSDEMVVRFCAPTLAGLKTGSLFSCTFKNSDEVRKEMKRLNHILVPKGLRAVSLGRLKTRMLIYVYRPDYLKNDLRDEEAEKILRKFGYQIENPDECIHRLIERLQNSASFPHEIGLFLGYPAEDVRGFIEHKAQDCKCIGTWKVYGDEEEARKRFFMFSKCTDIYCRTLHNGASLERLTVAVPSK